MNHEAQIYESREHPGLRLELLVPDPRLTQDEQSLCKELEGDHSRSLFEYTTSQMTPTELEEALGHIAELGYTPRPQDEGGVE